MFDYGNICNATGIRFSSDIMYLALIFGGEIRVISIDEKNDISIMLNTAAFVQVGKLRYMRCSQFSRLS
jgi:hypothetical protein